MTLWSASLGRRVERKIRTRTDLLEAGRKLFGERGLYESRIEDLAEQAGIAKGTVYQYFRDKDDLILAVVHQGLTELDAAIDRRTAGAVRLPTLVARIVAAHFEVFEEDPDLMKILHQVRGMLKFSRGPRMRPLRGALRRHVERVADRLEAALPAGARRRRRALALAALLFGAVSGVASARVTLEPRGWDLRGEEGLIEPFVALARAYVDRNAVARRRSRPARSGGSRRRPRE
jgi:TetR/AcrR family fatty acid metabolism transcriptional regulator